MINLNLPKGDGGVYTELFSVLVGPIGTAPLEVEEIPLRLDTDSIAQGGGIWGEKAVDHDKAEGTVTYVPYAASMRDNPSATYPFHKVVDVTYVSSPTVKTVLSLLYGDLSTTNYGYSINSSGYSHRAYLGTEYGFRLYTVTVPNSTPKRVGLSYVEVKDIRRNGSNVAYAYRSVSMVVPPLTSGIGANNVETSWLTPRSFADVMALVNKSTPYSLGSFTNSSKAAYLLQSQAVVSPSKMKLDILAFMAEKLDTLDDDPNKLIDYGELAMRATAKVNANDVNMFAFLRDLRDIKSLIPKLRNFWKLKTLADNYLSVEYGILPTIDDIKKIVRALQGIKPYLDRNGFQVVTAVHNATASKEETTFQLEQRIKVAIDNEDEGLLGIINRVDSMGFLLTFENLWDLVPYSFVIDWFLDIGGLLERVDANLRLLRLRVRYSTLSHKRTASVQLKPTRSFPYSGTIKQVQYHRWVIGHCPEPPLSLQTQEDFNHWIEAAALLIQRSKN